MKQTLLISFVLVAFGFVDYAIAQQTLERAEAPVYQDGDWWEFKVTNLDRFTISSNWLADGIYKLYFNGKGFKTLANNEEIAGGIPASGTPRVYDW